MKKILCLILLLSLPACRSYQIEEMVVDDGILNMSVKPKITLRNNAPYFLEDIDSIGDNYSKDYVLNIGDSNYTSIKPFGGLSILLTGLSLGIIPSIKSNEAELRGTLLYKDEPIKYYTAKEEKNALMMSFFGYSLTDAKEKVLIESNQAAFFNLMKQVADDADYIKEESKAIDKRIKERKEKEKKEAREREKREQAHNVLATAAYAEKESYCKIDEFKKKRTCYSPEVYTRNSEFSKYLKDSGMISEIIPYYQFQLLESGSVVLVAQYMDWNWAFLKEAVDIDGKELQVQKIDTKIHTGTYVESKVSELIGIILSKTYLKDHIKTGMKIKIYGKRKNVVVFVPGPYVEGFYNYIQNNGL